MKAGTAVASRPGGTGSTPSQAGTYPIRISESGGCQCRLAQRRDSDELGCTADSESELKFNVKLLVVLPWLKLVLLQLLVERITSHSNDVFH